jgi:hypothetical protein
VQSKGAWLLILVVSVATLSGCDGSLAIAGRLDQERCDLSLWSMGGWFWEKQRPRKLRTAAVGGRFDIHWTIDGPAKGHWLEIYCPGYGLFRSSEFIAPSKKVDLGQIQLEQPRKSTH